MPFNNTFTSKNASKKYAKRRDCAFTYIFRTPQKQLCKSLLKHYKNFQRLSIFSLHKGQFGQKYAPNYPQKMKTLLHNCFAHRQVPPNFFCFIVLQHQRFVNTFATFFAFTHYSACKMPSVAPLSSAFIVYVLSPNVMRVASS